MNPQCRRCLSTSFTKPGQAIHPNNTVDDCGFCEGKDVSYQPGMSGGLRQVVVRDVPEEVKLAPSNVVSLSQPRRARR